MAGAGKVLICRCRHAGVISREAVEKVISSAEGVFDLEVVDDLCGLAADRDERLKTICESPGVTIIACFPRAVKWLFSAAGAKLPEDATLLNLRTKSADEIIAELTKDSALQDETPSQTSPPPSQPSQPNPPFQPSEGNSPDDAKDAEWVPWFPVIDYDRCVDCGQCLNFCLFGVYKADADGKIRVVNPRGCKLNCPACARVCPEVAIIFPKYERAPINGSTDAPDENTEPVAVDAEALKKTDIYQILQARTKKKDERG